MNKPSRLTFIINGGSILGIVLALATGMNQHVSAQHDYNATTGNYMDDPDNPNNAENIIIQYCIDHADKVASGLNVVQDLVNSGLVPGYYSVKDCKYVQELHRWNTVLAECNREPECVGENWP